LLLLALAGINLWRTVEDGFVNWSVSLETRLRYQSVTQEMASHWAEQSKPVLVVADAYYEPIDADSLRRNLGYDPGARWVQSGQGEGGAVVIPGESERASLYVPEYAPLPVEALRAAGISGPPTFRSDGSPSFAAYDLAQAGVTPDSPSDVTFGKKITLMGIDLLDADEQKIRLLSYWRVEDELPPDLATFVHLVNQQGDIVSQHDGLDAAPQTLKQGDVVIQHHVLPVAALTTDGPFSLQLGLYERGSQLRLTHGGSPADRIIVVDKLFLTNA
jgi:hypothetical protein